MASRVGIGLVGLELLERRPDGRILVGGVLQLDDDQREAGDEQRHVRPALVLGPLAPELADGEEVVVRRRGEVDQPHLRAADATLGVARARP